MIQFSRPGKKYMIKICFRFSLTEMSCHVTRLVLFAGASIVPLCNERNRDFLHIFSKNFYIRFVFRRKIPPCPCNNPEMAESIKCQLNTKFAVAVAVEIRFGFMHNLLQHSTKNRIQHSSDGQKKGGANDVRILRDAV